MIPEALSLEFLSGVVRVAVVSIFAARSGRGQASHRIRQVIVCTWGVIDAVLEQERVIFKALTGREHEPDQRVDELVLVVGREGGKTRVMAVLAVYLATLVDHPALAVGERGVVLCVAQSQAVAKGLLRHAEGILQQSPLLRSLIVGRTQDTIELRDGLQK
jgi:hypothetical protein